MVNEGTMTISGATIANNSAVKNGGGVFNDHMEISAHMEISGASLAGNKAARGAGISNSGGVKYLPACDVRDQEVRQCAGSLPYAVGADLLISNSSVEDNIARQVTPPRRWRSATRCSTGLCACVV